MEHGEAKLHSTDEHAKRMLARTSQAGCAVTRDQLEDFHQKYENLKLSLTSTKQQLEMTFSRWTELEQLFDELNAWIKDAEMRMTSDSELKTDVSEKKAHLEKMKVMVVVYARCRFCSCNVSLYSYHLLILILNAVFSHAIFLAKLLIQENQNSYLVFIDVCCF